MHKHSTKNLCNLPLDKVSGAQRRPRIRQRASKKKSQKALFAKRIMEHFVSRALFKELSACGWVYSSFLFIKRKVSSGHLLLSYPCSTVRQPLYDFIILPNLKFVNRFLKIFFGQPQFLALLKPRVRLSYYLYSGWQVLIGGSVPIFNLQSYTGNLRLPLIVTCLCYALERLHSCSAKDGRASPLYVLIILLWGLFVNPLFQFFVSFSLRKSSTFSQAASLPMSYSL